MGVIKYECGVVWENFVGRSLENVVRVGLCVVENVMRNWLPTTP